MSASPHRYRTRALVRVWLLALLVWGILALPLMSGAIRSTPAGALVGTPVIPEFERRRSQLSEIRFTLADEQFTLRRHRSGWVMPEAGGYPVDPERLTELMVGLAGLEIGAPRTADADKHALLGVADPAQGGNGVRIDLIGPDGATETRLILGRRQEALYMRRPDLDQTYRLTGDLPAFYTRQVWLDVDILSVAPEALRAVRLYDAAGQTAYFRRQAGDGPDRFIPAPPHASDRARDPRAISTTATAISRLAPQDVRPADTLTTRRVARHVSETFDDLELDLEAYDEPGGYWITLRAVEAGDGARRAAAINARSEGWAFRVTGLDFQDFTPRISDLVAREAAD